MCGRRPARSACGALRLSADGCGPTAAGGTIRSASARRSSGRRSSLGVKRPRSTTPSPSRASSAASAWPNVIERRSATTGAVVGPQISIKPRTIATRASTDVQSLSDGRRGFQRRDRRRLGKDRQRGRQPFRGDPSVATRAIGAPVGQRDFRRPPLCRQLVEKDLPVRQRLVDRQHDAVEERVVQLVGIRGRRAALPARPVRWPPRRGGPNRGSLPARRLAAWRRPAPAALGSLLRPGRHTGLR